MSDMEENRMHIDKPEQLPELTPVQLCRQSAIEYIGLGGKSSGKVRNRLESLGFSYNIINDCISKLRDDAYINDEALARRVLRDRRGRRAEGYAALIIRMQNQGIPEEVAESIVYNEADDEYDLLLDYLDERAADELGEMQQHEAYSDEYQRLLGRVGRRAEGRGFTAGMIHRAIHELLADNGEDTD